uniref:Uncharacterized protein n=1 Tax=Lepeophtheirus salmonis TaxID=72036 RepID=A0A0K2TR95_LEPSM
MSLMDVAKNRFTQSLFLFREPIYSSSNPSCLM